MRSLTLGLIMFLVGYCMMITGFEPIRPPSLQHPALIVINTISDFRSCLVIALTIFSFGLYKGKREAVLPLLSLLLAALLTCLIKAYVGRPRPFSNGTSFPSGHCSSASSTYLPLVRNKLSSLGYAAFIVAVGMSRVLVGAHYLSDVISGIGLGIFASSLVKEAYRKLISIASSNK